MRLWTFLGRVFLLLLKFNPQNSWRDISLFQVWGHVYFKEVYGEKSWRHEVH